VYYCICSFFKPILILYWLLIYIHSQLNPYWHSVCYWWLTDIQYDIETLLTLFRLLSLYWHLLTKKWNSETLKIFSKYYTKPQEWSQKPSISTLLTFWTAYFVKKIALSAYGLGYGLDDHRVRIAGMRIFLSLPKRPDLMWGFHSVLVSIYWRSLGINRPRREPNNSTVSRARVMMHNTKFRLVLTFVIK